MKIAILTPTYSEFSGIDRIVEQQENELAKQGHEVTIFTLAASMKPKHAKLVELGMPNRPFAQRIYRLLLFLDRKKVNRVAEQLTGFDRVICHLYPMTIFASLAKKKNPAIEFIYHNSGVGIVETYGFLEKLYLKLFNWLNNRSIKNCDRAVSISGFLRDELQKETGIDSTVEYVPVSPKRFHPGIDGSKARKKFGIGKEPVLLYVGRISPHKGIHILLKAFSLVKETVSDAKLIIVGKPTFKRYFLDLQHKAPTGVIFAGFVPDGELPPHYAACDVYVTCSLWEGFDIPIVEASCCGKPSVAFDVGSHPEVLKNGKLVRKGDVEGFAEAVVGLLNTDKLNRKRGLKKERQT